MEHGIEPASHNQGDLLALGREAQFQHAVGGIAHQLDGAAGQPAADQANHLLGSPPNGFVPLAQPLTHFRGGRQDAQERQGPALLGPGNRYHYSHHDPAESWTADRSLATGERTIAVMAALADLAAPAPFQRFIDHQVHAGFCRDKGLDDQQEQLATHRKTETSGRG